MAKSNTILSSNSDRNKILKEHRQKFIKIKLDTNTKGIDTDNPVFIQEIITKGFRTSFKISGAEFQRSNVIELAKEDGTILWKKEQ